MFQRIMEDGSSQITTAEQEITFLWQEVERLRDLTNHMRNALVETMKTFDLVEQYFNACMKSNAELQEFVEKDLVLLQEIRKEMK